MKLNWTTIICTLITAVVGLVGVALTANARQGDHNIATATEQQLQVKVAYLAGQLATERSQHSAPSRIATTRRVSTTQPKDTSLTTILVKADSAAQHDSVMVRPAPLSRFFGAKAIPISNPILSRHKE